MRVTPGPIGDAKPKEAANRNLFLRTKLWGQGERIPIVQFGVLVVDP